MSLGGSKDVSVPAKRIIMKVSYKGLGHGLKHTQTRASREEHNLEWFGKYVFGNVEPSEDPRAGCLTATQARRRDGDLWLQPTLQADVTNRQPRPVRGQ